MENLQRPFLWFAQVEIARKKILEDLFRLKKIFEDLFFWRTLASVSLVLGLERVCPWTRNCFVALASSLVSSTPPLKINLKFYSVNSFLFLIRKILPPRPQNPVFFSKDLSLQIPHTVSQFNLKVQIYSRPTLQHLYHSLYIIMIFAM